MKNLPLILGISTIALLSASIVLYMIYPVPMVVNGAWIATALVAAAWAFFTRATLKDFFTRKSTRYGANLSFVVFLVLMILVFVNVLGKEYNWRKDFTKSSVNSLSPQTVKILKELNQDVKAYYFGSLTEKERNELLLKNYDHETRRFSYEFVDTARRPTFTQSMEVKKNDTVVLVLGDTNKRVSVDGVSEEKITNGLIRLLRSREQVVYFTAGHGERALTGDDPLSFSMLKTELEGQGYTIKELNLFSEGSIPKDAAVLIVGGPTRAFFPRELEILGEWLKNGGRAIFTVDLNPAENGLARGSRQVADLLRSYGITVHNQMLVDPTSQAANVEPQILLGFSGSREHPVTRDFAHSVIAANFLFPLTTHLEVKEPEGFEATPLVRTSQNAWAESDWDSLKKGVVRYQAGQDRLGQMILGLALEQILPEEEKRAGLRLAVFGTSSFAANSLIDKVGNRDLFLNTVAWLADDEQFISIRARDEGQGLKQFNAGVLNLVLLISVLVMPAIIIVAGVVVWIRRSKL